MGQEDGKFEANQDFMLRPVFFMISFMCMYMVCVNVCTVYGCPQSQERADTLEMGPQAVVSCLMWVLRAELGFSGNTLNYWAMSPAPRLYVYRMVSGPGEGGGKWEWINEYGHRKALWSYLDFISKLIFLLATGPELSRFSILVS